LRGISAAAGVTAEYKAPPLEFLHSRKGKDMKTRVTVAIVAIPFLVLLIFFAPLWLYSVAVGLVSAGASWELLRCVDPKIPLRFKLYASLTGFSLPVAHAFLQGGAAADAPVFLLVMLVFCEMLFSFGGERRIKFETLLQLVFAGGIMPLLLVSLVKIGIRSDNSRLYMLLPFVAAFSSDSGAYFAGRRLGKHKIFPRLSPNKTLEGCVGGVLSAVAMMSVYGAVLRFLGFEVSFPVLVLYGMFGSVVCQLGDLAFSAVKREFGIKDYGALIPGHGGVLDRFDSMHFTAPMLELLALLLPAIGQRL
jgi:phosphatidate cytidylyltransferase